MAMRAAMDAAAEREVFMSKKSDGVSCVQFGAKMIVFGGWYSAKIWELDLPKLEWTEVKTTGEIPPPRLHHTAVVTQEDEMLVWGGEILGGNHRRGGSASSHLEQYALNLRTRKWRKIEVSGTVPYNRSHHSATVLLGGRLIALLGGRPILFATPLTNGQIRELMFIGFFNVSLYEPATGNWKCITTQDPLCPAVWGHTATSFADKYVLVMGGCDVSGSLAQSDSPFLSTPATATLSNDVFILDAQIMKWSRCSAVGPAPSPRSLHCAHVIEREMIVFGGLCLHPSGEREACANDCWVWNIETGKWEQMEFCFPSWPSHKLLSITYGPELVVANSLAWMYHCDVVSRSPWQRRKCTTAPVENYVIRSPLSEKNVHVKPQLEYDLPASSQEFMAKKVGAVPLGSYVHFVQEEHSPSPVRRDQDRIKELNALKGEIGRLRELVAVPKDPPEPEPQPSRKSLSPKKLFTRSQSPRGRPETVHVEYQPSVDPVFSLDSRRTRNFAPSAPQAPPETWETGNPRALFKMQGSMDTALPVTLQNAQHSRENRRLEIARKKEEVDRLQQKLLSINAANFGE